MAMFSGTAASTVEAARPAALPVPPELPAGLPPSPRVLQLIDLDGVSHGLADSTPRSRGSDQGVQLCVDVVQATARALDPQSRVRCAASTATAAYHRARHGR